MKQPIWSTAFAVHGMCFFHLDHVDGEGCAWDGMAWDGMGRRMLRPLTRSLSRALCGNTKSKSKSRGGRERHYGHCLHIKDIIGKTNVG